MGAGGGGGTSNQNVKSEVTQTNLPAYVQPYFTNLLERTQDVAFQPYTAYQGQRIAGFTPEQQQVQQDVMNLQQPGQIGAASQLAGAAGIGSLAMAGGYTPTQFDPGQVNMQRLRQYGVETPQTFGQEQAQQYMSPYVQNVLDVQKAQAIRDAKQAQLAQNLGAARQGTYGGARQLLATTERERNLGENLAKIQATGFQSAYENAQQQFERDRAAQAAAQQQNLQARLQTQQLGTTTGLQAALANQQAAMEAQKAAEASRQFGVTSGYQGLAQALQGAQALGALGQTQQQMDLARLQAQDVTAAQKQALQQQYLDTAYQDFLRQQQYPMEQLNYYSSILHGVPVGQLNQTATVSQPAPSALSQLSGLGLGALALSKLA
jgi:hypothetical protein